MEILAAEIKRRMEMQTGEIGHCAIYEKELRRVWPLDMENREKEIAQFATEHGFYLAFYKPGLAAIFVKESPSVSG